MRVCRSRSRIGKGLEQSEIVWVFGADGVRWQERYRRTIDERTV